MEKQSDGTYALKGGRGGKYCADEEDKIVCDRDTVGSWERFNLEEQSDGSTFALKGGRGGKYCANEGFQNKIQNNTGEHLEFNRILKSFAIFIATIIVLYLVCKFASYYL